MKRHQLRPWVKAFFPLAGLFAVLVWMVVTPAPAPSASEALHILGLGLLSALAFALAVSK
jgi:hypothetical protein